jgi:hypothetical protein
MARRSRFALALLLFAALPHTAAALPIVLVEVERRAEASASAAGGGTTAADAVDLSDVETGALDWRSDAAVAAIPFAAGSTATPNYVGVVDAGEISASGSAQVNAHAQQTGAFTFGSAEVVQRIVFQASADALLRLEVDLLALARSGFAGDSFALVEIRSLGGVLDPNPLLIRRTAAPGEQFAFDLDFAVRGGASYEILALARASADALDFEHANFHAGFFLDLVEVPEPTSAVLVLLGAIALGVRRARA